MSKEEWLLQCSLHLQRYGCEEDEAAELAETLLEETCEGDITYDPVQIANEEVSYWD
jgi:hypothetical protein